MNDRVTPPTEAEINWTPAQANPLGILSQPDMASGVREGFEQATNYRRIAQALLDVVHRLSRENQQLRQVRR